MRDSNGEFEVGEPLMLSFDDVGEGGGGVDDSEFLFSMVVKGKGGLGDWAGW